MCLAFAVDELDGDPDAIRCFAYASFDNVVRAEFARNLLCLYGFSFVHENSVAGDYKKLAKARQLGDDVLGQPVSKKLLLRITALVDERQNRHRRLPNAPLGR